MGHDAAGISVEKVRLDDPVVSADGIISEALLAAVRLD